MKPTWIMDAGHGWLAVPLATCEGLDISPYSYVNGDFAYLEEDCDAGTWIKAKQIPDSEWTQYPTKWINGDWSGRNYKRFGQ